MTGATTPFEVGRVFEQGPVLARGRHVGRVRIAEVDVDPLMAGYRTPGSDRHAPADGPWYRVEGLDGWRVPQPVVSHLALEKLWRAVDLEVR